MDMEFKNSKVILNVQSGNIIFDKGKIYMNCDCKDAAPICGGFCCSRDSGTFPMLTKDEVDKFQYEIIDDPIGESACFVLAVGEDNRCVYQKDGCCTIHDDKPEDCRSWKCKVLELRIRESDQEYRDGSIRNCKYKYSMGPIDVTVIKKENNNE